PPLQPANVDPPAAVAVSVTTVPLSKSAEAVAQVVPQVIPAGLEVTVPLPVPAFTTASVNRCTLKVAVTVVSALIVTMHGLVPEQPPPLQPANVEPALGVAVRVTVVPL